MHLKALPNILNYSNDGDDSNYSICNNQDRNNNNDDDNNYDGYNNDDNNNNKIIIIIIIIIITTNRHYGNRDKPGAFVTFIGFVLASSWLRLIPIRNYLHLS